MTLVADGLMIAAAMVAAVYCLVLSARIRRLRETEGGLGGAIAALSRQVEGMQGALGEAKRVSGASARELRELVARAEMAAGRLELLLAALHDRDGTRPVPAAPFRRAPAARPGRDPAPAGPGDLAAPASAAPSAPEAAAGTGTQDAPAGRARAPRPAGAAEPETADALRRRLRALFGAPAA